MKEKEGKKSPGETSVFEALSAWDKPFLPSFVELAGYAGLSKATIQTSLEGLRRKGLVTWGPGKARTVRICLTDNAESCIKAIDGIPSEGTGI